MTIRKTCYGCFENFTADTQTIKYCSKKCRDLAAWEKREARLLDSGATNETLATHMRQHPKYRVKVAVGESAKIEMESYYLAMTELRQERIKSGNADEIGLDDLIKRDARKCHICGKVVDKRRKMGRKGTPRGDMRRYPTIDHIIPISRGGAHTWDNVKLAHWSCNSKRGASQP